MSTPWKETNKTILTLQMGDEIATWETVAPCCDEPIENIINAFYSQLVGFGFSPAGVLESFRDFADEHQPYCDPTWKDNHEYIDEYNESIDEEE